MRIEGQERVSLDKAVLARMEKGGKRYEVLVDPEMVDAFKADPNAVDINAFLAMDVNRCISKRI